MTTRIAVKRKGEPVVFSSSMDASLLKARIDKKELCARKLAIRLPLYIVADAKRLTENTDFLTLDEPNSDSLGEFYFCRIADNGKIEDLHVGDDDSYIEGLFSKPRNILTRRHSN